MRFFVEWWVELRGFCPIANGASRDMCIHVSIISFYHAYDASLHLS